MLSPIVTQRLRICFQWPDFPDSSFHEEFFLGAWHPSAQLQIDWSTPGFPPVSARSGANWFLLSSRASFQPAESSLVHVPNAAYSSDAREEVEAVAFRGYLLAPPIHSWSPADEILAYWSKGGDQHNGVFTAVRIFRGGNIELIGDAFGIASLYYRELSGALLFSTNSRFLALAGDETDRIAARILIQSGSVYGNRSLTQDLSRLPPGTVKRFSARGSHEQRWFDDSALAAGNRPVTSAGLREVEDAFQAAVDRCLMLSASGCCLPLSSGYDSRRILARLHSCHVPFKALTVRVLQKNGLDLDARWASAMANSLGFDHHVVELPTPAEYARLDRDRRLLLDAHGREHTWFLAMHRDIPRETCLVFDGLGGDVFGNTGFGLSKFHVAAESEKIRMILDEVLADPCDSILNHKYWPSLEALRRYLADYLTQLPNGTNKSDLAFLLMRCRSGPGMCSQRLIPAGHITVYPYFDLDYAHLTLSFDPLDKLPPQTLRSRCLEQFWPKYFAFPGTRRVPPDSRADDPRLTQRLWMECYNQLRSETGFPFKGSTPLTNKAKLLSTCSVTSKRLSGRFRWWLEPVLILLARHANSKPCWSATFAQDSSALSTPEVMSWN